MTRIGLLSTIALSAMALLVACGGGGGGGGGGDGGGGLSGSAGFPDPTDSDAEVETFGTTGPLGGWGRMDVVDGGLPPGGADGSPEIDPLAEAKAAYLATISTLNGANLDGLVADGNGDTIPDGGFESYKTGINTSPSVAARIFAANNIYDLFQTSTGSPRQPTPSPGIFIDGSGGGPGIYSNMVNPTTNGQFVGGTPVTYPEIPSLPNAMGDPAPPPPNAGADGALPENSRRGPSINDQHQFIQAVFPYDLDTTSLFHPLNFPTFLGDSQTSVAAPQNFRVRGHALQQLDAEDGDVTIPLQRDMVEWDVPVVAVVGGVTSIPALGAQSIIPALHPSFAFVPEGARSKLHDPNVLTLIPHEAPQTIQIVQGGVPPITGEAYVDARPGTILTWGAPVLSLPDPTSGGDFGGRVFGGAQTLQIHVADDLEATCATTGTAHSHPGSVNDFATHGETEAAFIGFFNVEIDYLRRAGGSRVEDPYFHTFDVAQDEVGDDPRAPLMLPTRFTRGPAIKVERSQELPTNFGKPSIDVLNRTTGGDLALDSENPVVVISPITDDPTAFGGDNKISSRARFLVQFDREVVPNSVGFSRRHTIQRKADGTIVFPFNGNTRPIASPTPQFILGEGAPLAASIYLAVNQPVVPDLNNPLSGPRKTNDPLQLALVVGNPNGPNGLPGDDDGNSIQPGTNGLDPVIFNTLATLPRAPVPVDIYPLNQNNLQAYVVEPLIEMPPGSVVTLGVTVQGLNQTGATQGFSTATPLPGTAVGHTNRGNYTRGGTAFTVFQNLTPTGLGLGFSAPLVLAGDRTVIKVNAGPMDFKGNLFYGGTNVSVNTLVDGGIPIVNTTVDDDCRTGGFNIARSWRVGNDGTRVYTNAPVSPMAMYPAFETGGMGVLDLNGTGFNTNRPGGSSENTGFVNYLIVSRFLPAPLSPTGLNFNSFGSFPNDHQAGYGMLGRYTSGGSFGTPAGTESEHAVGSPIRTGPLTPFPGVNEGSSGFETLVRNSAGEELLTQTGKVGVVSDIVVGDFMDTLLFDDANPFAGTDIHRTIHNPTGTISNNTISDPPLPNPPPLRYPVGLPHLSIKFDQDDLNAPPTTIEGSEVFTSDAFVQFNAGGGGAITTPAAVNTFIQLNPTFNASNPNVDKDIPPLPKTGFAAPFGGGAGSVAFVQTGPMPKTSTAAFIALAANGGTPNAIVAPGYSTRQQIGNILFLADRSNKRLHAVNSNTMEIIQSLKMPDPYGLGLTSDLTRLFVSNESRDSVWLVDADPRNATFLERVGEVQLPFGTGPRGISVGPDQEDAFVLGFANSSVNIVDVSNVSLRKTLTQSGLNRPWDIAVGMREISGAPAFQSGVYHAYISNNAGNNVLIYQSGPTGLGGIGFDSIIGSVAPNDPPGGGNPVWEDMVSPKGIAYDPTAPLDAFAGTVGCYVAHTTPSGEAMVTRIAYTADDSPGQNQTNEQSPGFGTKVFEVIDQYGSGITAGGLDVALSDYRRQFFEDNTWGTGFPQLFNAGAVLLNFQGIDMPINAKYPVTALAQQGQATNNSRWDPDRIYLSMTGGRIASFNVFNPTQPPNVIDTPADVTVLTSYFSQ